MNVLYNGWRTIKAQTQNRMVVVPAPLGHEVGKVHADRSDIALWPAIDPCRTSSTKQTRWCPELATRPHQSQHAELYACGVVSVDGVKLNSCQRRHGDSKLLLKVFGSMQFEADQTDLAYLVISGGSVDRGRGSRPRSVG